MSKLTDIEQMFGEVMIDGTPYRIAGTDIIDRINQYISENYVPKGRMRITSSKYEPDLSEFDDPGITAKGDKA